MRIDMHTREGDPEALPWIFQRRDSDERVVVWERSGHDAKMRAPIEFFERYGRREDNPILVVNPATGELAEARRVADQLNQTRVVDGVAVEGTVLLIGVAVESLEDANEATIALAIEREFSGSKLAMDPEPGCGPYPSGVVTPSDMTHFIRTRGAHGWSVLLDPITRRLELVAPTNGATASRPISTFQSDSRWRAEHSDGLSVLVAPSGARAVASADGITVEGAPVIGWRELAGLLWRHVTRADLAAWFLAEETRGCDACGGLVHDNESAYVDGRYGHRRCLEGNGAVR